MRRAYSGLAALFREELPPGVLDFDLITPHKDTYKTRLDPMGASFHSEARPWCDTHDTSTLKKVLGEMAEIVEQSPERFRVRVRFDMKDEAAADAYRKHCEGFAKGCSVGFNPVESHLEVPKDGQECPACSGAGKQDGFDCFQCFSTGNADATLVYDKYTILEGSSCATPSNPMALCVRSIQDGLSAAKRQMATGGVVPKAVLIHDRNDGPETLLPIAGTASHHLQRDASFPFNSGVFPMKPEHRGFYRYMVGDEMRLAGDYMDLMATSEGEARKALRSFAQGCMSRAISMTRMISDSMAEGHEDVIEDVSLISQMMRQAPAALNDAELAKEWEACQRAALPHAEQTFTDVGRKLAKDPAELRVTWAAMKRVNEKHKEMLSQQRTSAAKTEESERRSLVLEIAASETGLDPGTEAEMFGFDSIGYERDGKANVRASKPWSLEAIRRYQLQVQGQVAQVVRTAELRTTIGTTSLETTLKPAQPERNAQVTQPLAAFINEISKRTGADAAKVMAVAQRGANPGLAFTEDGMTKRISEIHAKRSA